MANKTISFRIPDEITEALEIQAQITGRSKTSLIIEALTHALALPMESTKSIKAQSLQEQLHALEEKVEALSTQLTEFHLDQHHFRGASRRSKLLDKAVISFQPLALNQGDLQEDVLFFPAAESLTTRTEEQNPSNQMPSLSS